MACCVRLLVVCTAHEAMPSIWPVELGYWLCVLFMKPCQVYGLLS